MGRRPEGRQDSNTGDTSQLVMGRVFLLVNERDHMGIETRHRVSERHSTVRRRGPG